MIEKAAVDAEVARLMAIKSVHDLDVIRHTNRARTAHYDIKHIEQSIKRLNAWQQHACWDVQTVKVRGIPYQNLQKAGEAIMDASQKISALIKLEKNWSRIDTYDLFEVGNLSVRWTTLGPNKTLQMGMKERTDLGWYEIDNAPYGAEKLAKWLSDGGPMSHMDQRVEGLKAKLNTAHSEAAQSAAAASRAFEHEERLLNALQRQADIDAELEIDADDNSALSLSQA